jgi:nicotinate-nucleotide adenylyltransferase
MLAGVRRGILGGTFDPPHLAHLVAAEAAYRDLALDVVSFIPAGAPWQKAGRVVTAATHRWEMSRLAVGDIDYLEADDREVRRDGWTYTIDTLGSFPEHDELVLILGADAAAGLPTWHRSADVIERAEVAVIPRPGVERRAVEEAAGRVRWLDTPLLPVSGTLLRSMRREGRSIRFLVREPVYAYIEEHGLYTGR